MGNGGYSTGPLGSACPALDTKKTFGPSSGPYEVTANEQAESLKRAAECLRLAEATSDPEMKVYLLKLGLSWMQVAAEPDERPSEESRQLKTLQDLVG